MAKLKGTALLNHNRQFYNWKWNWRGVGSLGEQWTSHHRQVINPSNPWDLREQDEVKKRAALGAKGFFSFSFFSYSQTVGSDNNHHLRECSRSYFCVCSWNTATVLYSSLYPQQRSLPNSRCSINFCSIEFVVEGVKTARNRRYQTKS